MNATKCVPQKIYKLMMGSIMLAAAGALLIIGVTLMPIFGLTLAVPVAVIAVYIFRLHLNNQCEIDFTNK